MKDDFFQQVKTRKHSWGGWKWKYCSTKNYMGI